MRTYLQKAHDAIQFGRGVTVSPGWLIETLEAMAPFGLMWREGDETRTDSELIARRGVACDADWLSSEHVRKIGIVYRDAMTPRA